MRSRGKWAFLAPFIGLMLIATACGDDGETASTTTTGAAVTPTATVPVTTGTAAVATVAGCEKRGYSDPSNLSDNRLVARCDVGAPAPKPLAKKADGTNEKIVLASNFKLEFNSPIGLGMSLGEFAKENLDIEYQVLSFANAVPQMATGQIDVAVGGIETALFGAGNQNLPVRWALGNYFPPKASNYSVPQTGLWCRREIFTTPATPNLKELETKKWATSVGRGSSAMYYSVAEILKKVPTFNYKAVEVQAIPSNDILPAIRSKNVDCGILLDPIWVAVKDDATFVQVATQTPGEPLGLMAYGKRLLQDRKDLGDAFARAYIRTVNTYYQGDYHKDAKVMAEIQKFTGQTDAVFKPLAELDSLTMDWEIRKDTTTRVQQLFIDVGVKEMAGITTPVPEDKLVDRSFYERAVGAIKK
jgi:NitT/TauT family transport system substrate-binding protein